MTIRLLPVLAVFAAPLTFSGFCQDVKPAAPPAAPAAEKRTLVFRRVETKGTKYEIANKASFSRTIDYRLGEDVQPGGGGSIEASLGGVLEVTEVSPKAGNVTSYTLTVKKMTLTDGSGEDSGLEPGTVITVKMSGTKPVYTIHGGEATGELKDGLELIMPEMADRDEPDDEVMAPPGPVAPGDKWDHDKKKVVENIRRVHGYETDEEKFRSGMSYKGPVTVGGLEADSVTGSQHFTFSKVKDLPEDAKLNSYEMDITATYALPRDVKIAMALSSKSVMESRLRYTTKSEGKEYEGDLKTNLSQTQTAKPVK